MNNVEQQEKCNLKNSLELDGLLVDISFQAGLNINSAIAHYDLQQLPLWIEQLKSGAKINQSENRAVLHLALRAQDGDHFACEGKDVVTDVIETRMKMKRFTQSVCSGQVLGATGKQITSFIHIGVGGSGLGPRLVLEALSEHRGESCNPAVHIVTSMDSSELADVVAKCDPEATQIVLASKSFSTLETLLNGNSLIGWLAKSMDLDESTIKRYHVIAATANPTAAAEAGIPEQHIFKLWDWVGGRFSLWSSIGLPVALALGYDQYEALLDGARAADLHFMNAPADQNIAVWLAVVGLWNVDMRGVTAHSVVAYTYRLRSLVSYLQQLEMESNGKKVDINGVGIRQKTATVLFGGVGSDVQHSYFQLLHQGKWQISSDFIAVASVEEQFKGHNNHLLSNCFAQILALSEGNQGVDVDGHARCEGGKPCTLILLPHLSAYYLGMLIALYEHKVYVQGRLLKINSFDQWGVELGKKIAKNIHSKILASGCESDSSERVDQWIQRVKQSGGI